MKLVIMCERGHSYWGDEDDTVDEFIRHADEMLWRVTGESAAGERVTPVIVDEGVGNLDAGFLAEVGDGAMAGLEPYVVVASPISDYDETEAMLDSSPPCSPGLLEWIAMNSSYDPDDDDFDTQISPTKQLIEECYLTLGLTSPERRAWAMWNRTYDGYDTSPLISEPLEEERASLPDGVDREVGHI